MKTVLVILDGLADGPVPSLSGRTPLAAARTPHLDRLAAHGHCGRLLPTPEGCVPGSDTAIPALLGMAPYPGPYGRAGVEATARGVLVHPHEAAFRINAVRVDRASGRVLEVASDGAADMVRRAAPVLAKAGVRLFPDTQGRHLAVLTCAPSLTSDPYSLIGRSLSEGGTLPLPELWRAVREHLGGEWTLWPWGGGPGLPFGIQMPFGTVISGVDLVRGLALAAGAEAPRVAGVTGGLDTDYVAKSRATLAALESHNQVVCHVESPDVAAHRRDPLAKVAAIEHIDRDLIGPLSAAPGVRVGITCDHGTSSVSGCHMRDPVPFLVSDLVTDTDTSRWGRPARFDEAALAKTAVIGVKEWREMLVEVAVAC
ncbi:MAG: hypothetical protein ACE5FN_09025 [Leptospirillia bacterium]